MGKTIIEGRMNVKQGKNLLFRNIVCKQNTNKHIRQSYFPTPK